jgi:hypothetical protein
MQEPEFSIDSRQFTSELAVQYRVLNKEDAHNIMKSFWLLNSVRLQPIAIAPVSKCRERHFQSGEALGLS